MVERNLEFVLPAYAEAPSRPVARRKSRLTKEEISQTINFARITLIVGLVLLHYVGYPNVQTSPFRGMDIHEHQLATFVNSFILFFFFAVVPLLSAVSGWLFFSFDAQPGPALLARIGRRFKSLYVPLVFWNVLFLAGLLLVSWVRPQLALLAELNIDFDTADVFDYVNAIFGLTDHPVAFQFWFVRDLFLTVLVSPLLWLLLRHAPYLGLVFLFLVWITDSNLWIFFRTDVLFFFYIGGMLRTRDAPLEIGWGTTKVLLALYLVSVVLRTLAPYAVETSVEEERLALDTLTRGMRLVGVFACWGLFIRIAQTGFGAWVARFGGFAFFLHAIHYPLIAELKILLWPLVAAETDGWMLIHYAASVSLTVILGMAAGLLLARTAPTCFALLNGGRLATQAPARDYPSGSAVREPAA